MNNAEYIHHFASIDANVVIGHGTKIWHNSHISDGAQIGKNCIIGQNVFVGKGVKIGNGCKIQNNAQIFSGVTLEDNVFIAPNVTFTNTLIPRADKEQKNFVKTVVREGATIGAGAIIICGNDIGKRAFIAAGTVVTKSVYDHGFMRGNPGRIVGHVYSEDPLKISYF